MSVCAVHAMPAASTVTNVYFEPIVRAAAARDANDLRFPSSTVKPSPKGARERAMSLERVRSAPPASRLAGLQDILSFSTLQKGRRLPSTDELATRSIKTGDGSALDQDEHQMTVVELMAKRAAQLSRDANAMSDADGSGSGSGSTIDPHINVTGSIGGSLTGPTGAVVARPRGASFLQPQGVSAAAAVSLHPAAHVDEEDNEHIHIKAPVDDSAGVSTVDAVAPEAAAAPSPAASPAATNEKFSRNRDLIAALFAKNSPATAARSTTASAAAGSKSPAVPDVQLARQAQGAVAKAQPLSILAGRQGSPRPASAGAAGSTSSPKGARNVSFSPSNSSRGEAAGGAVAAAAAAFVFPPPRLHTPISGAAGKKSANVDATGAGHSASGTDVSPEQAMARSNSDEAMTKTPSALYARSSVDPVQFRLPSQLTADDQARYDALWVSAASAALLIVDYTLLQLTMYDDVTLSLACMSSASCGLTHHTPAVMAPPCRIRTYT